MNLNLNTGKSLELAETVQSYMYVHLADSDGEVFDVWPFTCWIGVQNLCWHHLNTESIITVIYRRQTRAKHRPTCLLTSNFFNFSTVVITLLVLQAGYLFPLLT